MKPVIPVAFLAAPPVASGSVLVPHTQSEPQHIFANPVEAYHKAHRIPTSYESAVMGRRVLALTALGTLSTVFPSSRASPASDTDGDAPAGGKAAVLEQRPNDVGGMPIGLVEYIADCEDSGNPTMLAVNIATSFKNVREGSNISLSVQWTPPYPPSRRIESSGWFSRLLPYLPFVTPDRDGDGGENAPDHAKTTYSAANLPRFSLIGYLENISNADRYSYVANCFVKTHPDSKYWLPGNIIHVSKFVRLVVTHVYWIGGFGDRAYIGWIPVEEWEKVTLEEWQSIRLPGEKKGWKEWSQLAKSVLGLEL